jgi:repressor LexA
MQSPRVRLTPASPAAGGCRLPSIQGVLGMSSLVDTLTDRQEMVFDFIKAKLKERGYGPTVREIGEHFKISSPNGVMCHLRALEKKGLITRIRKKDRAMARAIALAPEIVAEEKGLPLVGTVAAGMTTLSFEQPERVDFADFFNKKNLFVLKVSGNSMIDAHIADGDYVVIKKQRTAEKGQMVVAQNDDGEATLKFWYPEANRVRLQPANSSMSPIYVKGATVMGIVVGVVRNLR